MSTLILGSTYASIDQVRAEFAPRELVALCDDLNAGKVPDGNQPLVLGMGKAHAEVTSNLAPVYSESGMPSETPASVSLLLVDAELAYLRYFLYARKPSEAAKISPTYLKDLWKFAQDRMDRVKDAVQEIAPGDNPPPEKPANVGGVTFDNGPKLMVDDGNGGGSDIGDY